MTLWAWNKVSKFEFLGLRFWLDNLNTGSFKNLKFTVHWENASPKAYCETWIFKICTSGVMATLYRGFFFFFFLFDPFSIPHRSYTWQATDLKFIVPKAPTKVAIQTKFQLDWFSSFWDIPLQILWSELWRFEPGTKSQNLSFWGLGFGLITWIRGVLKIWNSQYIERMHPQWRIVRGDSLKYVLLELWPVYIGAFSSSFFCLILFLCRIDPIPDKLRIWNSYYLKLLPSWLFKQNFS